MATPFDPQTFATLIDRGVLQIGDGHRAKLSELGGNGPIFLRAGLLSHDGIRLAGADRFREDIAVPPSKFTEPRDTFVTTKGNSIGRTGYIPPDLPRLVYSPHLSYWRSLDRDTLHPEFLRYWARSPDFVSQLHAMAHGTDMAPYLSLIDQKRLVIPLPPIQEQRTIAGVLGALDDKIDSNRRLGKLVEQTAAAMFHGWFVDFVGVDDFEKSEIGDIPRGWRCIPFSSAVEINPRVNVPKGAVTSFIEMAALDPWATRPTTIRERPYSGGVRYERGDVLVARITPCMEHGKGALIDFLDGPASGSTEFLVFRARPPLTSEVTFLMSRDPRVRAHAIASMTGSSGRQRVQTGCFDALKIALPPDEESWSELADLLRAAFAHTRTLWEESRVLARLRDTLLPKLISGELRVPDTRDSEEVIDAALDDEIAAAS